MEKINKYSFESTNILREKAYNVYKMCIQTSYEILTYAADIFANEFNRHTPERNDNLKEDMVSDYADITKSSGKNSPLTMKNFYNYKRNLELDEGFQTDEIKERIKKSDKFTERNNVLKLIEFYEYANSVNEIPLSYFLKTLDSFVDVPDSASGRDLVGGNFVTKKLKDLNLRISDYMLFEQKNRQYIESDSRYDPSQDDAVLIELNNTGEYPIYNGYKYFRDYLSCSIGEHEISELHKNGFVDAFDFTVKSIITNINDGTINSNITSDITTGGRTDSTNGYVNTVIYDKRESVYEEPGRWTQKSLDIKNDGLFNEQVANKISLVTISFETLIDTLIDKIACKVMWSNDYRIPEVEIVDETVKSEIESKYKILPEVFSIEDIYSFMEDIFPSFRDKMVITYLFHNKTSSFMFSKYLKDLSVKAYNVARKNQMTLLEHKVKALIKNHKTIQSSHKTNPGYIHNGIMNILGDDLLADIVDEINNNYTHNAFNRMDTISNLMMYLKPDGKISKKHFIKHILTFLFIEIYKARYATSSFRINLQGKTYNDVLKYIQRDIGTIPTYEDKDYYSSLLTNQNINKLFNKYNNIKDSKICMDTFDNHLVNIDILETLFSVANIYYNSLTFIDKMYGVVGKNDSKISYSTIKHIEKMANDMFVCLNMYLNMLYNSGSSTRSGFDSSINQINRQLSLSDYTIKDHNKDHNIIYKIIKGIEKIYKYRGMKSKRTFNGYSFGWRGDTNYLFNRFAECTVPTIYYTAGSIIDNGRDYDKIIDYICDNFKLQDVVRDHNFDKQLADKDSISTY